MSSRHIVLTTFGSFGDLHPHIALALELQRRGHRATIATSAMYQANGEALGLGVFTGLWRPDLRYFKAAPDIARRVMDASTAQSICSRRC
jgi:UDP:flavonoid glycosyltransferase YjiC (YdhE family)